jgi:hypothetical protein
MIAVLQFIIFLDDTVQFTFAEYNQQDATFLYLFL